MRSLTNPVWIKLKGILFVVLGSLATTILVLQRPTLQTVLVLAIAIWSFCRAYYFAFYVIEHYIDPEFRFSGLLSALRYLTFRKR